MTDPRALMDAFPDSWLDPLLTGPNAVVGEPPYSCQDVERLIKAIRARVATVLTEAKLCQNCEHAVEDHYMGEGDVCPRCALCSCDELPVTAFAAP